MINKKEFSMTRDAFIQFVNGKGNNAGLNDDGWRALEGQPLAVGVLEQSRAAVGVHFYSSVLLTQDDSLYGPWLATQLLTVFGEDCQVKVPRHRQSENMVQEGYAAEVLLPKVRFDNNTENDDRIRSFGRRFAKFLSSFFGSNADAVSARNTYFNEHREFVAKYAERRRDPQQRWGLSREELVAHSLSDGNTSQRTATVTTERAMSSLNAEIKSLLETNLNVILTGAPGTGKTYTAKKVAEALSGDEWLTDEKKWKYGRIASVQFHPGYDYSDFVVGMKPVLILKTGEELEVKDGKYVVAGTDEVIKEIKDAQVSYRWKNGVFKQFAAKARKAYDDAADKDNVPKFVFLIDEINRADLSRVFGELFSLLEEEYRYPNDKGNGITLPNGESFVLPKNLYIIGTMNDIDRSVESMDFALRRRFAWKEVKPEDTADDILANIPEKETLRAKMDAVNAMIRSDAMRLGAEYQLGGAFFAKFGKCNGDYGKLWGCHINNILS